jgi:hypothetical protein
MINHFPESGPNDTCHPVRRCPRPPPAKMAVTPSAWLPAAAFFLALALAPSASATEALPVPKPAGPGSCPFGYTTSGSFCVPAQRAQDAVAKPPNAVCPFGWTSSGNFCLRSEGRR